MENGPVAATEIFSTLLNLQQSTLFEMMTALKLDPAEAALMDSLRPRMREFRDLFDQAFMAHLRDSHLISYALPERLIDRIRHQQSQLFERLANPVWEEHFRNDPSRIEFAHQQMGLNKDWYFSAFRKYLAPVWEYLKQEPVSQSQQAMPVLMSLVFKIAMFDLGIALEVYSEVEKKRFFESYLTELRVMPEDDLPEQPVAEPDGTNDEKRAKLDKLAQHSMAHSAAIQQMSVVYLGLNQYQYVVDTHGFETTRLILQTLEIRMRDALRHNDILTHVGGGEFLFILINRGSSEELIGFYQSIARVLTQPVVLLNESMQFTASAGIASYPDDGQLAEDITRCAESAYHKAQAAGAEHLHFYSSQLNEKLEEDLKLIRELRKAIRADQLTLVYQPKVSLQSGGHHAGFEALLRWHHPELGQIPPVRFIPLAERSDMIIDLGKWVLQQACRQIALWREAGMEFGNIAVNISPVQFLDPHFLSDLQGLARQYGVRGHELSLEITESVLIHDQSALQDLMRAIKDEGFHFALDDFGTGYSALGYLKAYPFDYVKIDQSFVRGLPEHQSDASICKAIISMAHSMGIAVIAEGVEKLEQGQFLAEQLCDQIQGFYFSLPLSVAEAEQWLSTELILPAVMRPVGQPERTLLLVDDEPNILSALRRLLRKDGYRILTASGGPEGLEILSNEKVDVIMSDQRMPEMSGVEFLRQARKMSPDTVRIILSGYSELQYITDAINEGAIYKFLTKPWDDELIRKNIADAFAFKEMLTENHRLSDEIRVSNRELAYVNRQLSDLLYQQEHQIRRDQVSINVIREILHQMPFAVIGTDSEEKIVFCNLAAETLFCDQMLPLDEYVGTAMPALLPLLHETMEGAIRELNLHQTLYRACWKAMGQHSTARGKVLILFSPDQLVPPIPQVSS